MSLTSDGRDFAFVSEVLVTPRSMQRRSIDQSEEIVGHRKGLL